MDVTIWLGPIHHPMADNCTAPGSTLLEPVLCYEGSNGPQCPALASQFRDPSGRTLPRLLAAAGVDIADVTSVYLGSFSAGYTLAKQILGNQEDRTLVRVVTLADSSYSTGTPSAPVPIEPYVQYGLDVLASGGSKLFIGTASTNVGAGKPTPAAVLFAIADAIASRGGAAVTRSAPALDALTPPPLESASIGQTIMFGNWGGQGRLAHNDHRDVLMPAIWQSIVDPWAKTSPVSGPVLGMPRWAAGMIAAVVGFAGTLAVIPLWRKMRR